MVGKKGKESFSTATQKQVNQSKYMSSDHLSSSGIVHV